MLLDTSTLVTDVNAAATGNAGDAVRLGPSAAGATESWALVSGEARWEAQRCTAAGPQIIAVTSGKGGVGKSNIAAGLSILLAAAGTRVALVDADLGLGNLDVLLGVGGGPTLSDVLAERKSLREVLRALPCGVSLAAGGSGPVAYGPTGGRRVLLDAIAGARQDHDVVILDCGSGLGDGVMDFCWLADHVLVVTTPEPTALTDAYGMIKSLAAMGHPGRVSVLVNQACDQGEAKRTYARVAGVSGQFLGRTVYEAGHVVADPKVPRAVRRRMPFVLAYPRCPASRCLTALAVKLRPRQVAGRDDRPAGLLRRVLRWLD